jgi:hypothetical protein
MTRNKRYFNQIGYFPGASDAAIWSPGSDRIPAAADSPLISMS